MEEIKSLFDLKGRVAIVTGASKGIGAAIARGLAEFGAKVVISSRKQEALDDLAASMREEGLEVRGIECHVGKPEALEALVEKTVSTYGGVDILVNNAAINPVYGPITQTESTAFDKIMGVNLKAPFLLSNLVFPIMKERGGGSVINISSVEGSKPSSGLGIYSVSKAALIMLTKSQAKEWGAANVRSNVICPGLVQTKFSAALWQNDNLMQMVRQHLPAGRMAQPNEMAGLAVLLASDAGAYSTGSVFVADGGHLIAGM